MEREELYERLRIILSAMSAVPLPRHEAAFKLLTNMFDEDEAEVIVAGLKQIGAPASLADIAEAMGRPAEEMASRLEAMAYKGLIRKAPPESYVAAAYSPGTIMNYYAYNRSDPENMKRVAEANIELLKSSWTQEMADLKHGMFRVLPAVKPVEKTIEINRSIEVEHKILPFEILKEYISKIEPQSFTAIPCACRESARLSGDPCRRTDKNFCISLGPGSESLRAQGVGRAVSLDELMDMLERAEKEGLVHQTINMQDTAGILCNCCPCCCLYLKPFKETGGTAGALARSNFEPVRDSDLCALCETCAGICPTGAIFHHLPHKPDGSDDYMTMRPELCLGCGLCASNCPNGAITLRKVRETEPPQKFLEMAVKSLQGRSH